MRDHERLERQQQPRQQPGCGRLTDADLVVVVLFVLLVILILMLTRGR